MKEYEMLRQEIMENANSYLQYHTLLYTTTAAILAFIFEKDTPLLCLLPYIVIVPIYFLIQQKRKSQYCISAYMIVFLEGNEYNWETRLYTLFDRTEGTSRKIGKGFFSVPSHLPSLIATLICATLATYKTICSSATLQEESLTLSFIWITTITIIVIMISHFIGVDYKDMYVKQWQALKAAEDAQKRKNPRNPQ